MKRFSIIGLAIVLFLTVTAVSEGAQTLTMSATPNEVIANGYAQIQLSARLLDNYNRPMAKKTVTFTTTAGKLLKAGVKTDANGWAYNILSSGVTPGQATVVAKFSTAKKVISASTNVTFVQYAPAFLPSGIYSLLDGSISTQSLLADEYVEGISIRGSWNLIEKTEGVFDWSRIDSMVALAGISGKQASIAIMPGTSTPEWVYTKGARKFTFTDDNIYHSTYGQELYSPMPWDDIYLTSWKKFIRAFGLRYKDNPVVSWVRITGPMNTTTMDWTMQTKEDWDKYIGTVDEFSDARLIAAINEVTDIFAAAFPSKPLSIAVSRTKVTDDPPYLTAATEVTDYGFATYPGQFLVQVNGWNGDIGDLFTQMPEANLLTDRAPDIGAQMIWSATNDPDCRMNGGISPCDPYTSLVNAVQEAIDYNLSFLEIYANDIMNSDLQSVLGMFE